MRYWGLLVAKLLALGIFLTLSWKLLIRLLPPPGLTYKGSFFGFDLPWTLIAGAFFLFGCGLAFLAIHDQRYRCRVCVRRLRMPISTGSWGRMLLFGRPRIEYICPYGHGTLKVPALQISGLEAGDWLPNEDMWKELYELEESEK